ncbi:MAG: phosphoribosylglycinamide formyltransferase [Oligoflexia bacterium]|nr:phosphoribosylglycinamide formyltransferase [Oligoflexia bacterium]
MSDDGRVAVGVLASGSGTNLQALLDACANPSFPARIAVVLSNRKGAPALDRAHAAGVPVLSLPKRRQTPRAVYDALLVEALHDHGVVWVCLAGYMLLVSPAFLSAFPDRVLNIHPALLPAFPGIHAQQQALDHGVRIAGATVHLVDEGCDTGPVICQGAVPVFQDDDVTSLSARILTVEHQIYPRALRMAVEGRLRLRGRRIDVDLRPGESRWLWTGA